MKLHPPFLINFLFLALGFFATLFCLGPLLIIGGVFVLVSSTSKDNKIRTVSMLIGVALGFAVFVYMDAQGMIWW